MKYDSMLLPKLMLTVIMASVVTFAQSADRKCWIKSMVGSVKVRKGEAPKWIDARVQMPLLEKDAIRTYVESEGELQTSEGSTFSVGENSTFEVAVMRQSTAGAQQTQ